MKTKVLITTVAGVVLTGIAAFVVRCKTKKDILELVNGMSDAAETDIDEFGDDQDEEEKED